MTRWAVHVKRKAGDAYEFYEYWDCSQEEMYWKAKALHEQRGWGVKTEAAMLIGTPGCGCTLAPAAVLLALLFWKWRR